MTRKVCWNKQRSPRRVVLVALPFFMLILAFVACSRQGEAVAVTRVLQVAASPAPENESVTAVVPMDLFLRATEVTRIVTEVQIIPLETHSPPEPKWNKPLLASQRFEMRTPRPIIRCIHQMPPNGPTM